MIVLGCACLRVPWLKAQVPVGGQFIGPECVRSLNANCTAHSVGRPPSLPFTRSHAALLFHNCHNCHILDGNTSCVCPYAQVLPGTIYTKSTKKVAEHGGLNEDDYHVALLVSGGGMPRASGCMGADVDAPVMTRQVAPTILRLLGIEATCLQAVQQQGTTVLPALFEEEACERDEYSSEGYGHSGGRREYEDGEGHKDDGRYRYHDDDDRRDYGKSRNKRHDSHHKRQYSEEEQA